MSTYVDNRPTEIMYDLYESRIAALRRALDEKNELTVLLTKANETLVEENERLRSDVDRLEGLLAKEKI